MGGAGKRSNSTYFEKKEKEKRLEKILDWKIYLDLDLNLKIIIG